MLLGVRTRHDRASPTRVRRRAWVQRWIDAALTAPRDNGRMTGRRARPVGGGLVGLANVDAVNRGVEACEPAFGLVADGLLVLQVLIGAVVHGEDDQ